MHSRRPKNQSSLNPSKVLVLGSDTRSFLTVIRSLGRAGIEVHVAWCAMDSVAIGSKYVHEIHRPARPPHADWMNDFRELLDRENFDLVIPCNDPSILPLHERRNELSDHPIYLIDKSIFEEVMDKAAVNRVASQQGICLPKEVIIASSDEIESIDQLRPPYVLKPTRSFVGNRLSSKNHVAIERDQSRARHRIETMLANTPVAVQEFFEGRGVGVEFLARDGKILTAFQHVRLHEPPRGGGSSYRKSCPLDPSLKEATEQLAGALHYTGVGMAEYRYNDRTKEWIFVELNSRFWGSLPLAVACGTDFPRFLFEMICHGRSDFPMEYATNRTARNWLLDARWFPQMLAVNGLRLNKQLQLFWQIIRELRYPLTLRESSDVLTWDDPRPGMLEIKRTVGGVPPRIRKKAVKVAAKLTPVRRHCHHRTLAKLKDSQSLLFVCKGNICRSPFAELYVRANLPQYSHVESCGYFPKPNRPSPEPAQSAASAFGIVLEQHRSKVVSQATVDRADAIVVFDEENRAEIRSKYPTARAKTHLLGWLMDSPEYEIADPYGGDVDDFRKTYTKISSTLDQLRT